MLVFFTIFVEIYFSQDSLQKSDMQIDLKTRGHVDHLSLLVLGGFTVWLALGGAFYVGFTRDCEIRFAKMVYIGIFLAYFVVLIWATVRVFSSYNEWTYEDKKSETYCEYTPFVFAMVVSIVNWIFLGPFLVIAGYDGIFNWSDN